MAKKTKRAEPADTVAVEPAGSGVETSLDAADTSVCATEPRRRMSGEEMKASLRHARREKRQKERGY